MTPNDIRQMTDRELQSWLDRFAVLDQRENAVVKLMQTIWRYQQLLRFGLGMVVLVGLIVVIR